MTSTALSAYSHAEEAYMRSGLRESISYHFAQELSVSCAEEESWGCRA